MATATDSSEKVTRTVNKDLLRERRCASFDPKEVTHLLDGAPENTKFRKETENIVFSDPAFKDYWKLAFKSRSELYEDSLVKGLRLVQFRNKYNWTEEQFRLVQGLINRVFPLELHCTMFLPAIERLATEAQKEKWLPLARNFKWIGAYAQTEIGHGTYLPGLETKATYDPVTEEFILNTPSISAMKWWPGGLGNTSTHAIVLASLETNGKKCGMQAFMVQLRSLESHMPLPGIEVGDIGPKMSANYVDNGYLSMKNVRIPRQNMLMKNAQVSKEGKFNSLAPNRANYATMTYVRVTLTDWTYDCLRRVITIAIRYSAVRHQSKLSESDLEPQILDYQTQQYKLFPVLANVYALFFMSKNLHFKYNLMMNEIQDKGNFKMLPEMHAISCGLKALASRIGIEGASVCRTACGGHGFLEVSALPQALGSMHAIYTVEGEYTVVCLQTARYLIKQIAKVASGETVTNTSEYLNIDPQSFSCPIQSPDDCLNLQYLCDVARNRANSMIRLVASRLQAEIESGILQQIAMNNNLQALVRAAEAHSQTIILTDFVAGVTSLRTSQQTTQVLTRLCQLFALHTIVENSGDFLETESVGLVQIKWIKEQELKLMTTIRPDAVSLVDAFDLHDESIISVLGAYDGNVYERLYESAKYNPMNQSQVHPAYHKYLKPLLSGEVTSKL